MRLLSRRAFVASSVAALASRPSLAAPAPAPPLLIDSHVHVWKHDRAFPFAEGAHPPSSDASIEMLLDLMAANGVARTVLIQVIHYRWDNTYLASALRRYPKLFAGVCRVNPQDPAAPDHLSRLVERDGFHGVRLSPGPGADGDWIRGPLMPPLWRRCAQLKVPMTLLLPVSRLPDVDPLIEANPDLDVVIDHMADCPLDDPGALAALLALRRFPRVRVKLSHLWSISRQPFPYADTAPRVQQMVAAFTPKRLMWGTDWPVSLPFLTYAQAVALFRDHHLGQLSPADRDQILSKTVQQIWPFGL